MLYVNDLTGSEPYMLDVVIGETVSNEGVPILAAGADQTGVRLGTTTGAAEFLGFASDTATYTTTQSTDNTDIERTIKVNASPSAVWSGLLSGGATEGTALTLYDVTTASSTGLAITTGDDWTSPQFDEGTIWGQSGQNVGLKRKITSTSSTAATVIVPFRDTVVGDNFLRAPYWEFDSTTVQLTTNLYQINAAIAVGTGAGYRVVRLICADSTTSYAWIIPTDHVLAA
jgi:hypothetical protein